MDERQISQVRVKNQFVGIIGLEAVLAAVREAFRDAPDDQIKQELLRRLSAKNYIPAKVREDYADAFLREYRKFCGMPSEDEADGLLEIKILGPGCSQCNRMEMEIMNLLTELALPADLRHVRDIKEIGAYGIMGMPALVINGRVMASGSVPPRARLAALLKEAAGYRE